MKYLFVAAGKGTRLGLNMPKCLVKVHNNRTILQENILNIRKVDNSATIGIVTGYKSYQVSSLYDIDYRYNNPFYSITNNIASVWVAKGFVVSDDSKEEDILIINGDILYSELVLQKIIENRDSKIKLIGDSFFDGISDYKIKINKEGNVIGMGKEIKEEREIGVFNKNLLEYAGAVLIPHSKKNRFMQNIDSMIKDEQYNEWYETAIMKMIVDMDEKVGVIDINGEPWAEIDNINDFIRAKEIFKDDKK